jgi:hypothetical protein
LGSGGLIFKGSGFYLTDYKNRKASGERNEGGMKTAEKGGESTSPNPLPASSPTSKKGDD